MTSANAIRPSSIKTAHPPPRKGSNDEGAANESRDDEGMGDEDEFEVDEHVAARAAVIEDEWQEVPADAIIGSDDEAKCGAEVLDKLPVPESEGPRPDSPEGASRAHHGLQGLL